MQRDHPADDVEQPRQWRRLGYVPMLLALPVAVASITRFRRAGLAPAGGAA